jgi:hypothetical protein
MFILECNAPMVMLLLFDISTDAMIFYKDLGR